MAELDRLLDLELEQRGGQAKHLSHTIHQTQKLPLKQVRNHKLIHRMRQALRHLHHLQLLNVRKKDQGDTHIGTHLHLKKVKH